VFYAHALQALHSLNKGGEGREKEGGGKKEKGAQWFCVFWADNISHLFLLPSHSRGGGGGGERGGGNLHSPTPPGANRLFSDFFSAAFSTSHPHNGGGGGGGETQPEINVLTLHQLPYREVDPAGTCLIKRVQPGEGGEGRKRRTPNRDPLQHQHSLSPSKQCTNSLLSGHG